MKKGRRTRPLYPSYFKLHVRWLSSLTPVTYLSKLLGIRCVAAFLQLELFRVYILAFYDLLNAAWNTATSASFCDWLSVCPFESMNCSVLRLPKSPTCSL